MHTLFAQQRLSQYAEAREYVELGARLVTVQRLTGLRPPDLHRWFYRDPRQAQFGRPPNAVQWYTLANLLQRVDACLFAAPFQRLITRGFAPKAALLNAYRGYLELGLCQPRVDFDRAVDLAGHIAGLWLTHTAHLIVLTCPLCACDTLSTQGLKTPLDCPFCQLQSRYPRDKRVRVHFPTPVPRQLAIPRLGISAFCPGLSQSTPTSPSFPRRAQR